MKDWTLLYTSIRFFLSKFISRLLSISTFDFGPEIVIRCVSVHKFRKEIVLIRMKLGNRGPQIRSSILSCLRFSIPLIY